MIEVQPYNSMISFSSSTPNTKIDPIVVTDAIFIGKAAIGAAGGTAVSWGTTRLLIIVSLKENK